MAEEPESEIKARIRKAEEALEKAEAFAARMESAGLLDEARRARERLEAERNRLIKLKTVFG